MEMKKMNKDEFCTFLRSIPKAEVHLHIEAVPTIETLRTLHKKRFGTELSDDAVSELFSYDDLNGFIQSFLKVQDMFTSPNVLQSSTTFVNILLMRILDVAKSRYLVCRKGRNLFHREIHINPASKF